MFAELLDHAGVVEELVVGSPFGLMAFHGGSLERGTDQIAAEVARRAGASLYAVRLPDDFRWHVPSNQVDPRASPALAAFLDHVEVAVAIHGYGRAGRFTTLLAGGTNRDLAAAVAGALRPALDLADTTYEVLDDLDAIPPELRGQHPDNPVNRPRSGGVQLELPPRVRGLGPWWDDPERRAGASPGGMMPHTEALIRGLADVAASWCETRRS